MNFDLTDEQRLLKDSIDRLVREQYAFEQRRQIIKDGWRPMWRRYAELGFLGLPFGEEHGGSGAGMAEVAIVMEALGRALAMEPYLSSVVLAGTALRQGATEAQKRQFIPELIAGSAVFTVAFAEPNDRGDFARVACTARSMAKGWSLSGEKALVLHGDSADWFIVSARSPGAAKEEGVSLFLVDTKTPGVKINGCSTIDGAGAADVEFTDVHVPEGGLLGQVGGGWPVIENVLAAGVAATAAEAVGCMDALMSITTDYLKTRKQFGQPIGAFQALQHRAADMLIELECARSMSLYGVAMWSDPHRVLRSRAMSAVKARVGRAARFVGQQAIQLHGAIGMTEEYPVSHYFRKLTLLGLLFGDGEHHLSLLSESL